MGGTHENNQSDPLFGQGSQRGLHVEGGDTVCRKLGTVYFTLISLALCMGASGAETQLHSSHHAARPEERAPAVNVSPREAAFPVSCLLVGAGTHWQGQPASKGRRSLLCLVLHCGP